MRNGITYWVVVAASSFILFFQKDMTIAKGISENNANGKSHLKKGFHRGVNHAHIHQRGHGYGSEASSAELDTLKNIGIDWVAIMPYGYQHGATATAIIGYPGAEGSSEFFERSDPSLTDDDVRREITNAHAKGIHVTIKPHIWSNDFWNGGKEWHGTIRQLNAYDHRLWWESYQKFVMHYVKIAVETNAEQLCVGTELVSISTVYPVEWRAFIKEIRKIYKGSITYSAHWEKEFEQIRFWDAMDFIGISAYFPLDAPDSASIATLVEHWKPIRKRIEHLSVKNDRPVIFMEAGYRAMSGTFRKPWEQEGREDDIDAQTRAYEALFRSFVDAPWWHGVYFWKTFTDPRLSYEHKIKKQFSFRGLPTQSVVRAWFTGIYPH